jgi:hypothetical protein
MVAPQRDPKSRHGRPHLGSRLAKFAGRLAKVVRDRHLLRLLRLNEPRAHMTLMAIAFIALGVTLWVQPGRYANTPAYANLIAILPQHAWSAIYLGAAALKVLSIVRYSPRVLLVVTHTVAIILISAWLLAFVVRYLTDDGTTIVNVVSWSTFLYLAVRSALMMDDHTRPGE